MRLANTVCEVKIWCVTHIMDISFLLYWMRNVDWACLSSVRRSYKSNVPSFAICLPYMEGNTGRGWLYTKVPESSKKKLAFLCLCVKTHHMCNFDHSFFPHLRYKRHICFSTTLLWMHSTHPANLVFNEEYG
jgi:hypothetical protein